MTKAAYVGVSGKARKIKKGYIGIGGSVMRSLPSGYTQLAYIESTGEQYIDTGVYPNQDTRVIMTAQFASTPTTHSCLFGARNTNTNQYWCYYRYNSDAYSLRYGSASDKLLAADPTSKNVIDVTANVLTIGGSSVSSTEATFTSAYTLYLFGANNAGSLRHSGAFRAYGEWKIYEDGVTLTRDYVPAKSGAGEVGLYDMITKTFLTDAAGVGFIAGTELRNLPEGYYQLEYIESTGSQYIDTGICPNQNTRLVMDAQITDATIASQWLFCGRTALYDSSFGIWATPSGFGYSYGSSQTAGSAAVAAASLSDRITFDCNGNTATFAGQTISFAAEEFQSAANITLLARNTSGTVEQMAAAIVRPCQIYGDGTTLDRDYVPAQSSNGEVGLFDMVTQTLYPSASSTAFIAGPSLIGTARKIKKAYIGVGGVARPFWSGGELAYYGTATALSNAVYNSAATSVGDYALFGGGYGSSYVSTVNAYDKSLTRSTPTNLQTGRYNLAAASNGDYALFGGGYRGGSMATVDAYNTALTRSTPTTLSAVRYALAAASIGDYALFGGGYGSGGTSSTIDAYNKSLTRSTPTALSWKSSYIAAASNGDYALFGGGYGSGYVSTVNAYDKSLTRSTPTALSAGRAYIAAASNGDYVLFGGGYYESTYYSTIDAYNTALTRSTPTTLSKGRNIPATASIGDYALFGGGGDEDFYEFFDTVDAYDTSLTRSIPPALSCKRGYLTAASVGDYALFGGGYSDGGYYNTVDVYTIA